MVCAFSACAFSAWASPSTHTVFRNDYTVWQNGEVLLWSASGVPPVSPQEFCHALIRENGNIGNPYCRDAGEWHRDTVSARYGLWLAQNMARGLEPRHLKARGEAMAAKLQNLDEQNLVFFAQRGDTLWYALFNANALEPRLLGYFTDPQNEASNANALAAAIFGERAQRRLSQGEKDNLAKQPDRYFREQPPYAFWVGLGAGYAGTFSRNRERVVNYVNVQDSSTAWSILESNKPTANFQMGAGFFDFLGVELAGRYSYHKVKRDTDSSLAVQNYALLDHWGFHNLELWISLQFSASFEPHRLWQFKPYFGITYLYSIWLEDISATPSPDPKAQGYYDERLKFHNPLHGGALSVGNRVLFAQHWGLDLRAGYSIRGRSASAEGNDVPTAIGEITGSWFAQALLEFHLRWR